MVKVRDALMEPVRSLQQAVHFKQVLSDASPCSLVPHHARIDTPCHAVLDPSRPKASPEHRTYHSTRLITQHSPPVARQPTHYPPVDHPSLPTGRSPLTTHQSLTPHHPPVAHCEAHCVFTVFSNVHWRPEKRPGMQLSSFQMVLGTLYGLRKVFPGT